MSAVTRRALRMSIVIIVIPLTWLGLPLNASDKEKARLDRTEQYIRTILASANDKGIDVSETDKLSGVERYESEGFKRALVELKADKASDFREPFLIVAKLLERNDKAMLVVFWLGAMDNITGAYLLDGSGKTIGKGKIELTFDAEALLQLGVGRWSFVDSFDRDRVEEVSIKDLTKMSQIGLIKQDGSRTSPIAAFIDVKLLGKKPSIDSE